MAEAGAPSYMRDVRPILASKCFACHGPDESHREADLRLDDRTAAVDAGAISPGKPGDSELLRRVLSHDGDERMPPPDAAPLTAAQQDTLRRWIAGGAEYERQWSFTPPVQAPLPTVKNVAWPKNAIDPFVLARLEAEGMQPAPPADPYTLVRRVYLDLTGLPPSPAEADAYVHSTDPQAYEKLVDRLLASQQYGEHWARQWLDLARYADTNGYEKDRPRQIWPYRDWVIQALNNDMPFDQFSIEQLAGDMLPDATPAQRIATGFHRNTMLNEEGGIDPLEFRHYAMIDRVATTGVVWLGLTTGCAQCHTHKYDPITHTDYYRFMALLNNADEPSAVVRDPAITARREQLQKQIDELEAALPDQFPSVPGDGPEEDRRRQHLETSYAAWLEEARSQAIVWRILRPSSMEANLPRLERLDDGSIFSTGDITKRDLFTLRFRLDPLPQSLTSLRLEVLPDERLPGRGPGRSYYEGRQGDFFLSEVTAMLDGKPLAFASASHSYGKISVGSGSADAQNVIDGEGSTGWSTSGREGESHQLVLNLKEPLQPAGELVVSLLFERHFAASLGRFRLSAASSKHPAQAETEPVAISALLARAETAWNDAEREQLRQYFLSTTPELADARKKIAALEKQLPEYPTTLVMQERPADNPRPTFRYHRGEYLSPREAVTPGTPGFLPPLKPGEPANRLGLARWLVSKQNPLAGRVAVNRAWQAFFGQGLVRSPGDLGVQSEMPSHPQLLDWLAVEFTTPVSAGGLGWSQKQLHRRIVTSAVYQQSSKLTPALLERDRENRLLGRGPRFRVDAETVRDAFLKASGRLAPQVGGPSVYPPQPESVTGLAYGKSAWPTSTGDDRFRRSLYTFRKRTAPFAAYAVFDAPTGENCIVRRNRSNTPLQSLTLLNDAMFLELALALVDQTLADGKMEDGTAKEPKSSEKTRAATATALFRALLTRPPRTDEVERLAAFYEQQTARLQAGELDPAVICGAADASVDRAAWFLVARVLMNVDEAVTKQ
ncbi:Planctomycete cytochrome C [Lignipirellula cremea]|uniref:Planctomycete cytochrome C n=2 Tax=Lignipirellula cremea TaxID=2528010 RepID=A0A518DPC8_9BACT|nr:Planctomycete cytochrome C [Lignipirellula cremea]